MGMVKGLLQSGKIRLQRKLKVPNYLTLETTSGSPGYFWANSSGALQYGTTEPTSSTYDSAGTSLTTTSGANAALDNLSSVAVNTHIVSDTDSTDNLGSSSIFWANAFIDKIYLYSTTHAIDGSGGSTVLTGDVAFGVSGTGIDVQFYGTTAGKDMLWDESRDALTLTDSAKIEFGASQDLVIYHDGTDNHIDSGTANMVINIGENTATDVIFHGANDNIHFDADADLLRLEDTFILGFGTGGSTDYDIGISSTTAPALTFTQKASGVGVILKGVNNKGIDETWYSETDGDYMMWDQDGGTGNVGALTFEDSLIKIVGANTAYEVGISTDAMLINGNDHASSKLTFGKHTTTNGLNIEFLSKTSGDHVVFDAGALTWTWTDVIPILTDDDPFYFGSDSAGDVAIAFSGSANTLDFTLKKGTTTGMSIIPYASATVAALEIDGDANGFLGASNVGMLHLRNDIALTHVNSSALVIDVGTTKPKDAAEGYCFRIIDTSLVATTPPAYAAYIDTTANEGLAIETRAAAAKNLVLMGVAGQTDMMLHVDGGTGAGWDGADGVGMVQLNGDGAHAHANASLLNIVDATGASIAAGRGTSLRIIDTTTVGADSWVAYVDTTKNDGLLINTGDAASINLKLTGLQAQTSSMMVIDGSTGTGWDGADDTGMVHLTTDNATNHTGGALLYVTSTGALKAAQEGGLARFIASGTATTDAYAVEIAHTTTGGALHVSSGHSLFAEYIVADEFRYTPTNRTATDTGATTGTILAGEGFVALDTTTADDLDIVILPAAAIGTVLWVYNKDGTYDFELTAAGSDTINGGSAGGASTVGEDVLVRLVCVAANTWIASQFAANGTESKLDASA